MSGEVLDNDRVAALVAAAKAGQLPEKNSAATRRRRLRTVDFTRPTKFSADQERRLRRSIESFCRTASTRLAAELRMPLELDVIGTSQHTWANAHAQLPEASVCATLDLSPLDTKILFAVERGLILSAIERLLGGSGSTARERKLTEVDNALAKHLMAKLIAQLSLIWNDLLGLELTIGALDGTLDVTQLAPVSEPTLAVAMEARLGKSSSMLSLLIPWRAISTVIEQLGGEDHPPGDPARARLAELAMRGVDVTVRAEVAEIEMSLDEVLALRPGDVLRLGVSAEAGVVLAADDVPVHRGRPGRSGSRRAVQVDTRLEGGR